jgi:DNA-binding MarR family transcriptional regulator
MQEAKANVCAFTHLRRASRAVAHLYDVVLSPAGLKTSQFVILRTVGAAGEIAQCDLAEELVLSVEALSRRLAWARKADLVSMRMGEHGRRIYTLTAAGEQRLAAARPYWTRAQARLKQTLGESNWAELCPVIDRITSAAQQAEALRTSNRMSGQKVPARPRGN